MSGKTVLAFDIETLRLASEVEEEFADELIGASPWSRPDLFGYGVGCIIDVTSGVPIWLHPGAEAADFMVRLLESADLTVSYNGEDFDLGVLSAYRSVEGIKERHVDLNLLVRDGLDALPIDLKGGDRIRQGGLDGLARANGLEGKTASGTHAPQLLRESRIEEVLRYCEADVRLVANLYRLARDRGTLFANGYSKRDGQRIELGRLEVPVRVLGNEPGPVGIYTKEVYGYPTTIELWRTESLAGRVGGQVVPPNGTVCGAVIVDPDIETHIETHIEMAGDDAYGYLPDDLLLVAIADYAFSDAVPSTERRNAFWLFDYPSDAPPKLVEELQQRG